MGAGEGLSGAGWRDSKNSKNTKNTKLSKFNKEEQNREVLFRFIKKKPKGL